MDVLHALIPITLGLILLALAIAIICVVVLVAGVAFYTLWPAILAIGSAIAVWRCGYDNVAVIIAIVGIVFQVLYSATLAHSR